MRPKLPSSNASKKFWAGPLGGDFCLASHRMTWSE
jgi:hypothetical protein